MTPQTEDKRIRYATIAALFAMIAFAVVMIIWLALSIS